MSPLTQGLNYRSACDVHYTLACVQKNHLINFCSLLDIRENVSLYIGENVEWPHFFLAHPVVVVTNFVHMDTCQ